MSTEVYIIRHGETNWNKEEIIQGHKNSKLSKKGKQQARNVGKKLRDYEFDVIYSSDLNRALDTASYINKYHNQVIIIDELLRERSLGILEGKKWHIIRKKHPEAGKIYHSNCSQSEIPGGGESQNQFANRIKLIMDKIAIQEEGKKVLIVSHGGFIGFWMKLVLDIPLNDKKRIHYIENGSINKFIYQNGEWFFEKINA